MAGSKEDFQQDLGNERLNFTTSMNFPEPFPKFTLTSAIEKIEKEGNICEHELDILYASVLSK